MMMKFFNISAMAGFLLASIIALSGCDISCGCQPPPPPAHKFLSEYGFFQEPLKNLIPNQQVIPYDLINPLFSDYAHKDRFVFVPQGRAEYRSEGVFDFPQGSILIKNFSYTLASGERQHIETRIIRKTATGWEADTYHWNAQQTEAERHVSGATVDLTFRNSEEELVSARYLVPDKNQCKTCHSISGVIELIGPAARNLNFTTDNGRNQLQLWQEAGVLEGVPDLSQVPKTVAASNENANLAARARAYLDINCGHCHNAYGSARNSGLFLDHGESDATHLGFCKIPVAAGTGTGGYKYVISPGSAETSILWYRMSTDRPADRMPELGRTLIHQEGVELLRAWIDSMQTEDCGG